MRISRGMRQKRSPGKALLHRWPFLLACTFLGILLTGIVLLARPPIYEAQATVRFDPQRYTFPITGGDRPALEPLLVQEARDLLALQGLPSPVHPEQSVDFLLSDTGVLLVVGRDIEPAQAQAMADQGSVALSEAIRSIHGWNLLRTLLRRAIYLQGEGRPETPTLLTPHLFDLFEAGFLSYDRSIPVSAARPALTAQDVADITLAVQRMEDRQTAHISALFARQARTEDPTERTAIEQEVAAVLGQRERLRETLLTLYGQGDTLKQSNQGGAPPEVAPAGRPEEPAGPPRWFFLFAGMGAGLLLAAVLALFDESLGLAARLREILEYKDLTWNLVLRDLKARYKSSILGYLWSLVNPLLLMAVFTVLFKFLLKSSIPNFPVFIIVALLPWNFCATSVAGAVTSITAQSNLIKKVYFPREVIPISTVIANLINYLLALPAMIAIMLLLNAHFQPVALLFPLIVLIQTIFLLGAALFLSCLNVFFRDTEVIMEVLLTAWFFLTPVFYRLNDIVDEQLSRLVRWLNPMASLVDFYRDIFYLGGMPGWDAIIRTLITALLVLLVGYLFFLRFSSRFGEEI